MFKKRAAPIKETVVAITEDSKDQQVIQKQAEPTKRVKQQDSTVINQLPKNKATFSFGSRPSIVKIQNELKSTTATGKDKLDQRVHSMFANATYTVKAQSNGQGGNQIIAGDRAEQLAQQEETVKAKEKFIANAKMTQDIKAGKLDRNIYRGLNGYANYNLTDKDLETPQETYKKIAGPTRSANYSSGIKNTCRLDSNPSLCKDWNVSGYCVFGNSCIYIHDRSVQKSSFQLDKEFESSEKKRWSRISQPQLAAKQDLDTLLAEIDHLKPPQCCPACSGTLMPDPIQLVCLHMCCFKCACSLIKCPTCKKKTEGIMNSCADKLKKQQEHYEQHKENKIKQSKEFTMRERRSLAGDSLGVFKD